MQSNNTTPTLEFRKLLGVDTGKPILRAVSHDLYASDDISEDGIAMGWELTGETPNGNRINGFWVLRQHGKFIDYDQYRTDMAERHNFQLIPPQQRSLQRADRLQQLAPRRSGC